MKKVLIIIICKLAILAGKLLGRGSTLPGEIALKLDKDFLYKLKYPKNVIAVTGSSGKGSTTNLIANVYRNCGYTVVHNSSGSNLRVGILTSALQKCNLAGTVKKDVFVVEMDERWAKIVFPAIKPNYVVITNITRDQPPRQGNFDLVYDEIKKALTPNMHLILNADDPYLQKFNLGNEFKVTYYGIAKNKYSYKNNKFENLNFIYCPNCNNKLKYNFFHFENIGDYYCPNCNFSHPKNDFVVNQIDYKKNEIEINDNKIKIPFAMLFAIYNTLSAYTALITSGIDKKEAQEQINKLIIKNNQFNCVEQGKRLIYTLNNKNENSTTFNQSLLFVERDKGKKTIIIGWKEISRRYKYNDLSWLYDINFELLKRHDIEKIICVGDNCYDIAVRIKLSGIDVKSIKVFNNLEPAVNYLKAKTSSNAYAILNFDYVKPFNQLIRGYDK